MKIVVEIRQTVYNSTGLILKSKTSYIRQLEEEMLEKIYNITALQNLYCTRKRDIA